jgi:purine-binding chemotaxis protein CheW
MFAYPWETPDPPMPSVIGPWSAAELDAESLAQPDCDVVNLERSALSTDATVTELIELLPPAPMTEVEHTETPVGAAPPIAGTPTTSEERLDSSALDTLVSSIDDETAWTPGEFEFEEKPRRRTRAGGDSCIVFLLGTTRYGIPIRSVLEMDAVPRITPVPNVPGFVRGVTNVRGEIIAVLDLRALLELDRAESPERGRILIVRTSDQQTAALVVDEVRGTAELSLAELVQPSGPIHGKVSSVLLGVGDYQKQVLNVLDVDKLFRTPDLQQFTIN